MYTENRYDFKRELLKVHKDYRRDYTRKVEDGEYEIPNGFVIVVPNDADAQIMTAARDFEDYLFTSMGISARISKKADQEKNTLVISLNTDLGEASGPMGYRITTTKDGLTLEGYEKRGIQQGLYFLEDLMNVRKGPFLKIGVIARKSRFYSRSTSSPFGMYAFNDEALSLMAHAGMTGIGLGLLGPNTDGRNGYVDVELLCERAEKYGLTVGVSLCAKHNFHPDDEGAYEYYDNLYGKLLKSCPKISSISLVGETTEFKSKDPKAGLAPRQKNYIDNIPTGKCTPGWWPCRDYPEWIDLIKKVVRKYNPKIGVGISSYNWGYAPEEDRLALIKNLPDDVSLNATWDMFEQVQMGNSTQDIVDYSLSFVGPGKYFLSEAKAAKERGIKFSANSQTSGRTWDFGVIPYEPMPYQWIKRYKAIIKAAEEYNIRGLTDNIHYAFQPSIILDLEKYMFFTEYEGCPTPEEWLKLLIARDYGDENVEIVDNALRYFSEGITYYPPTNEDQYGAWRVGPSYPLWTFDPRIGLNPLPEEGKKPVDFRAEWGNYIFHGFYTPDVAGRNSLPGVRIYDEIELIKKMQELFEKGYNELESINEESKNLIQLKALVKFMINSCKTTINVKELYIRLQQLNIIGDKQKASKLLDEVEQILLRERENVLDTIPAVRADSRLGWEPSMEYMTDENGLNWKLRQLDHELNVTLPKYRKSNSL